MQNSHFGRVRRALGRPWRATVFLAAGLPLATIGAVVLLTIGIPPTPAGAVVLLLFSPLLTRIQRDRYRVLYDVEIPPTRHPQGLLARLRSRSTWRPYLYHLLLGPLIGTLGAAVVLGWAAGVAMVTCWMWRYALPLDVRLSENPKLFTLNTVGGVVVLAVLPWASAAVARLDCWAGRNFLGPDRAEVLEKRVEVLAVSRAGVVDAADAERRRIERDLHDGAQQRLVSLAVNLGLALATMPDLPSDARTVIQEAHAEAKAAIEELSLLVRGLHPAVLDDRGLSAALSGIAERSVVPVRLTVTLPQRPPPTVEAVAYFTVSEALANVAKHSKAEQAEVEVRGTGDRLLVRVWDDGVGGADASDGTGLRGLALRAASVDGRLTVRSPQGGPTEIRVELPCVR
ncbi:hypothetical protein BIV57_09820 [Mangrovactinospora gilvigrisea]|uniref:histidine kinase n=1 Tax=Mangrovactinospora gilvigrisea TaxID=1428644 RepID=A0A1J7CDC2_9ACTN|nr:histidine kinase [Mangrovactinospora gilvigrisea]OIV37658.1 hypothetical protein BIV57_09820 [Mangrovactinospora gilvigrisea]